MSDQFLSILLARSTAVAVIQHHTHACIYVVPILSLMEIRR
jgi:hypothetical protein